VLVRRLLATVSHQRLARGRILPRLRSPVFRPFCWCAARFAGIGGLSEVLGWTEVQQQYNQGFMGGSNTLLKVRGVCGGDSRQEGQWLSQACCAAGCPLHAQACRPGR
jgi:hypothetical protein